MSSISAQGVVERASAELTKRINGLGLKASKHHGVGKASVMERVTNALCGSGEVPYSKLQTAHNANATPEKPSRSVAASVGGMPSVNKKRVNTRGCDRMMRSRLRYAPGGYVVPATWDQLMQDDHFLGKFFLYFNAIERRILAQVCTRWRDILYARPRLWAGLVPVIRCREFRIMPPSSRIRLYDSLVRRGFHSLVLLGAVDEDIRELIHRFPQSQRSVHSLSLKCCAVTDLVLETLLDHLQELFELELAGCNEITETGLWNSLSPKIVSLSLSDCINVANEAVGAVVELLPSLYEFSLQAYHVTDAAFEYFKAKQSSPLRILRLQSCWELTNHGVHIITQALPNLTVLSLSGCSKVTNNGVELIAENLPELRSLDLSWCSRITDAALEYIACELINLEELTLDRCVHITDIGVGYISKMETLNALFLRWCSQLRDFGLQHLCGMKSLQVLSVAGCPLLTSTGLSSLIQLRRLHELELTNCPGTSQELFDYLREHLPRCLIIE